MNKFIKLTDYLKKSGKGEIAMTFAELESIIGVPLPDSARKHAAYFANTETHSISKAWMAAGYYATDLDIASETITFRKKEVAEEKMLSTDVLFSLLKEGKSMGGNCAVTCFSLFELLSLKGCTYEDVASFIGANRIRIVGPDYAIVKIDDYNRNAKKIETVLLNLYNSVVSYSLLCSLINVFRGQKAQLERVFDVFDKSSDSYLFVDLPLINDANVGSIGFQKLLSKMLSRIDDSSETGNVLVDIGELDCSKMSRVVISGTNYFIANYCNYLLREFIASCNAKQPFIPFSSIVEMLNVDMMSNRENVYYYTMSDSNYQILLGETIRRVIRVQMKN